MPKLILPEILPKEVRKADWDKLFTAWQTQVGKGFVGDVVVNFVTADEIASLNEQHAGKTAATDVLSFTYDPPLRDDKGTTIGGEVVICPEIAAKFVERHAIKLEDEFATLFVHGLLHLAGWDHATDEDRRRYESATHAIIESGGYQTVSLWLD